MINEHIYPSLAPQDGFHPRAWVLHVLLVGMHYILIKACNNPLRTAVLILFRNRLRA